MGSSVTAGPDSSQQVRLGAKPGPGYPGGMWDRVVAAGLGFVVWFVVMMAVMLLTLPKEGSSNTNPIVGALSMLLLFGPVVYLIGCWATTGQTIGMKLMGIRVVREPTGEPLGWLRAVVRFVSCFPCFFYGVGFLPAFMNKRKRSLHDLIAGSVVVEAAANAVADCPSCGSETMSLGKQTVDREGKAVRSKGYLLFICPVLVAIAVCMVPVGLYILSQDIANGALFHGSEFLLTIGYWSIDLAIAGAASYFISAYRNRLEIFDFTCVGCSHQWTATRAHGAA